MGVRESHYRHVFSEPSKQKYEDLRPSNTNTESVGVRGNSKFYALAWQSGGGGSLAVLDSKKFGRLPSQQPLINGHAGAILDFEFSPFDECMVATASEDLTVKIWQVPPDGLKENMKVAQVAFEGHGKKVQFCTFNPTACFIIASAAFDNTIRVWDIAEQEQACSISTPDQVMALKWNYNGSLLAAACKDKKLRIFDPRAGACVGTSKIHEGVKASKVAWIGHPTLPDECHKIVTTGFSSQAERQIGIWDVRNFSNDGSGVDPITMISMDQGTGSIFPVYDEGTGLLYVAGKGDANVRFFEVTADSPYLHYISDYRAMNPQKGFDFLPKRCCDTTVHEIMRGLKLEATCVHPISFRVPRKSEAFQEDIFPDGPSPQWACTNEEWRAGAICNPKLMSLRPGAVDASAKASAGPAILTVKELKSMVAEAQKRIQELEQENAELKAELSKKD